MDVAVDELHDLSGIEAVGLSQVDEQLAEALLGLTRRPLGSRSLLLLAPRLAARCRTFYLRRIGIVGKESSEGEAHYLLEHILLVPVLEVAHYLGHEGSYLLLVDVDFLDFIDSLEQLLGAYLLWRRQLAVDKLLAYLLLYAAHLVLLLYVDDAYRGAFLACAARASAAVGVVLDVVGQSVVYHVGEVVHVEAPGSHVGSHEQLRQVRAELLHREVALLLREVAVERLGIVAVAYELVGHLLRLHFGAAEDDGIYLWMVVNDTLQGQILVLCVDEIEHVVHVFGSFVAASHHYLLVFSQVALGYAFYLAAHGGREEQRVALLGHAGEYLVDALRETHVEHFVGLVEHHVCHLVELGHSAVHQVDESSGRCHDDLHALSQCLHLSDDVCSAINGLDVYARQVAGKVLHVVGYLQTELARGAEHYGLGVLARGVDALEQGYAEGCRLAGARLGQCYHVVAVAKQIGDNGLLHGHGLNKAQLVDGAQYLFLNAKFLKCHYAIGY